MFPFVPPHNDVCTRVVSCQEWNFPPTAKKEAKEKDGKLCATSSAKQHYFTAEKCCLATEDTAHIYDAVLPAPGAGD